MSQNLFLAAPFYPCSAAVPSATCGAWGCPAPCWQHSSAVTTPPVWANSFTALSEAAEQNRSYRQLSTWCCSCCPGCSWWLPRLEIEQKLAELRSCSAEHSTAITPLSSSLCRCWSGSAERPHLRCWWVRWHGASLLCGSLQHPHRFLDHCNQHDHPPLLRGGHRAAGKAVCNSRVRGGRGPEGRCSVRREEV